jgi:hypothetical protein
LPPRPDLSRLADPALVRQRLGPRRWQDVQARHPDLLINLCEEHRPPLDQLPRLLATLGSDESQTPDRKENREFDVHSMVLDGKAITLALKMKGGEIVDIARPSLLNGPSSGVDQVMKTSSQATTLDLTQILHPSRTIKVPLRPVAGKIAWVNWPLLEQALATDDKMHPGLRDELLECCRDRRLAPELKTARMNKYALMVDEKKDRTPPKRGSGSCSACGRRRRTGRRVSPTCTTTGPGRI